MKKKPIKKFLPYNCFCCRNTKFIKINIRFKSFFIKKCKSCSTLFINKYPSQSGLIYLYEKQEKSLGKPSLYSKKNDFFVNFIETLRDKLVLNKIFKKFIFLKDKKIKVLDYGSGDGYLASFLNKKFKNGKLYTFDKYTADLNKEKNIIHFRTLSQIKKKNLKFDIIILKQIIEHVPYPINFINKLKEILKKDGYLYIETPNFFKNVYFNFFREYYAQTSLPYHINFFQQNTIKSHFKNEYKIIKVYKEELPILGLSIKNYLLKKIHNEYFNFLNLFLFPVQILISKIFQINTNIAIILKNKQN